MAVIYYKKKIKQQLLSVETRVRISWKTTLGFTPAAINSFVSARPKDARAQPAGRTLALLSQDLCWQKQPSFFLQRSLFSSASVLSPSRSSSNTFLQLITSDLQKPCYNTFPKGEFTICTLLILVFLGHDQSVSY